MYKFTIFDIKDFYLSILEKLLTNPLNFSIEIIDISREDMQITYHARKSFLFNDGKPWMKRKGNLSAFTTRAYDGVEVCRLIGVSTLNKFSEIQ